MFIEQYQINKKVCSDLIEYFNISKKFQKPGLIGDSKVDTKIKDSMDLLCFNTNIDIRVTNYLTELSICVNKYKKKYIYSDKNQFNWGIIESPIIQKYEPNGGFKTWHFERDGLKKFLSRHLVFMTYLNTVKDGGGTEFYYQNKKFKAKQGLTLIWPADWTFTHKGIISKKYEKYIITGWLSYY